MPMRMDQVLSLPTVLDSSVSMTLFRIQFVITGLGLAPMVQTSTDPFHQYFTYELWLDP